MSRDDRSPEEVLLDVLRDIRDTLHENLEINRGFEERALAAEKRDVAAEERAIEAHAAQMAFYKRSAAAEDERSEMIEAQKKAFELAIERDRLSIRNLELATEREEHSKRQREELDLRLGRIAKKVGDITGGEDK